MPALRGTISGSFQCLNTATQVAELTTNGREIVRGRFGACAATQYRAEMLGRPPERRRQRCKGSRLSAPRVEHVHKFAHCGQRNARARGKFRHRHALLVQPIPQRSSYRKPVLIHAPSQEMRRAERI
jgi:hypothetical protein